MPKFNSFTGFQKGANFTAIVNYSYVFKTDTILVVCLYAWPLAAQIKSNLRTTLFRKKERNITFTGI